MSSVSLSSVSVRFDTGSFGLSDVDLDVADGEFLSLVGPSGSGKTTLLRTIAGFSAPTLGEVRIGGQVVAGARSFDPPERRGLGMVFQEHAVWPHWNVRRNVEYPLRRAGVDRTERHRRVDEALELVGLTGLAARRPATLSGGQRQRIALARALVARPRVLLLDEALSALDEPLRDRLRLELRRLTRELGLTVIHVTHDRQEALALADRVAVLRDGRIAEVGPPAQILRAPRSPFVAEFLSDATLVSGSIDAGVFTADDHPLTVDCDPVSDDGRVLVAIVPDAVRLSSLDDTAGIAAADPRTEHGVRSRTQEDHRATVRSSLFTATGSDLVIDWHGLEMRVRTAQSRFAAGEEVHVGIDRALVYRDGRPLADPVASPPAASSAPSMAGR
ncbi:Spermidine/putrescine import ATP-binding protein PotA [Brevibacterium casei]|uniref:ABC-type quaternary amine transporter n=1 Tax=Brevibacterium casei TaxID=33889 RepID=A0A449DBS6_9MICO|nr:ABC transporter ATP-binding protein [Brevibacterium casei]QPS34375.1 ABC transporter ATP-binding protein [Brevibacterium casei]VEW15027.1 Spermidine/putrescine import ATP-binding protein PotA [Brevibacterium casei]